MPCGVGEGAAEELIRSRALLEDLDVAVRVAYVGRHDPAVEKRCIGADVK
jgi:hypothetical protein